MCKACLPEQQQALLALLPLLLKGAPSYSAMVGSGREHAGQPVVLHSTSAWWACLRAQGADAFQRHRASPLAFFLMAFCAKSMEPNRKPTCVIAICRGAARS